MDGDSLLGELLDKIVVASELFVDLLCEERVLSGILTSSLADRGQVFPINRVIDVAAKVELYRLAEACHFVVIEVIFGLCVTEKVP